MMLLSGRDLRCVGPLARWRFSLHLPAKYRSLISIFYCSLLLYACTAVRENAKTNKTIGYNVSFYHWWRFDRRGAPTLLLPSPMASSTSKTSLRKIGDTHFYIIAITFLFTYNFF